MVPLLRALGRTAPVSAWPITSAVAAHAQQQLPEEYILYSHGLPEIPRQTVARLDGGWMPVAPAETWLKRDDGQTESAAREQFDPFMSARKTPIDGAPPTRSQQEALFRAFFG